MKSRGKHIAYCYIQLLFFLVEDISFAPCGTYGHIGRLRNRASKSKPDGAYRYDRPHERLTLGYHKMYMYQRLLLFALHMEVFGFGYYEILNLGVAQADIELCINFIDWISRYISTR